MTSADDPDEPGAASDGPAHSHVDPRTPHRGSTDDGSTDDGSTDDGNGRLRSLEAAESRRREGQRLDRRFELTEAILLSIAAVLAAWAGFQSAKWSGVQADDYARAGATRVEATRAATRAGQEATVDVIAFTQWLSAAEEEGLFDQATEPGQTYEPDPEVLSGFLYQRFRPEFEVAANAWLATQPRLDPRAPPTPFEMPEYKLTANAEAERLEHQAQEFTSEAREANERADNYVLMTIMFATVLFFAGISSKMDTAKARMLLLGMGITVLVIATAIVVSFPKEL